MATKHTPLVLGNWKMNPMTEAEAVTLAKGVKAALKKAGAVVVGITPPTLYIPAVAKIVKGSPLLLGVQHTVPGPVGAFTGNVSPAMVRPYGVTYALVGHSEQRAAGLDDTAVNAQVLMLLKQKLRPVICVGETVRDEQAAFYHRVEAQLQAALVGVPASRYKEIVIAYEPIWAIGTGRTAAVGDVEEMRLFIHKVLTNLAGRTAASAATVLYGGSVTPETATTLYRDGEVHGFLVGGASLKVADFTKIITSVVSL